MYYFQKMDGKVYDLFLRHILILYTNILLDHFRKKSFKFSRPS